MIVAVVPAAGHSTRMGCSKLALSLGQTTILQSVVIALQSGGVDRVVVVVGPHVPELVPLAVAAGADVCQLASSTPDMRATVECGLAWIEQRLWPVPEAWFLAPADYPALDAIIVRQLYEAFRSDPNHSVFVPAIDGKRGHPVLVAWRHVANIRRLPPGCGINSYFRMLGNEVRELRVADDNVLRDLDTPEDYERLRKRWD